MINLWFKNIFGKIPSTDKIEEQKHILENEWEKFQNIKNSELLARYNYLNEIVHSDDFLQRKKNIELTTYKNSNEEKLILEFESLAKDKNIKSYFKTKESESLKRYNSIIDSDILLKYNTIREVIDSGEVEAVKNKLSEEYSVLISKQKKYNTLKKNSGLKKYFKIINSDKYKTYLSIVDGELVNKYDELKEFVEDFDFKQINKKNKSEFEDELTKLGEYKKIKKNSDIRIFLKIRGAKIPEFISGIEGSDLFKDFMELKDYISSSEFETNLESSKFVNSEMFKLANEYKVISKNSDIVFYHKFEKKTIYKNYIQISESNKLKRYNELKEKLNSDEFIKTVEYLKDNEKYKKTKDYKLVEEFEQLSKNVELVWFNRIDEETKFAKLLNNKLVFADEFNQSELNKNSWSSVRFSGLVSIKENYSTQYEKQCFVENSNIELSDSIASIITKKESAKGKLWDKKRGFIDHEFDYTSGTINTAQSFRFNKGRIEVKLKVSKGKVVHGVSLKEEKKVPHIDIFRSNGKSVEMRYFSANNEQFIERVKGLNITDKFYIYSCEWSENELIWCVNDVEVCRTKHNLNDKQLYINIASILEKDCENLPNYLQIDWVRVYQLVK